ncbi:hypothetical protein VW23_002535 [Devosia insulae DS-56]|uniref:Putative auto-transporter adhesin head GIN domain-containing protein n=1 Tax=Devosia insulae DS-56 TaxID=1116389 RepID=A0A1E5XKH0_9HYPH|nr:DUF2807 domain-containing protein [Devosia insulae]OEO29089.1 hypothetical protein VW23_002535 [Devosia insulae DS-56]
MLRPIHGALLTAALIAALSATTALAETRSFAFEPFTGASFASDIDATIVAGAAQSVTVDARNAADLEDLRIEVVNGKLNAWVERDLWDVFASRDRQISVVVSVPVLDQLDASAGASVEATGMSGNIVIDASSGGTLVLRAVDARSARINASSGAKLSLTGQCLTADIQLSSSASVAAEGFECGDLDIEASSASSATFFAKGHVNATASSAARISLAGHPRHVDDEVSSGGDVDVLY